MYIDNSLASALFPIPKTPFIVTNLCINIFSKMSYITTYLPIKWGVP